MAEQKVLATVNGAKITKQNVDEFIGSLDPKQAAQFQSEEGQKRILTELINRKLFLMNALDNNLDEEEEFKERIKEVKSDLLTQYAISNLLKDVGVSMEDAEQFYKDNTEMFKKQESVKASHILFKEEEEANKVLKRINEDLPFEDAANTYSLCTEENGGDLGYFTKGKMIPEFEDAAFSMKIGEVSKPVKTQFGYHIIKVYDKKAEEIESFDIIKHQIKQQLTSMKQRDVYDKEAYDLKSKYKVDIIE